jgi:hypothetical protein
LHDNDAALLRIGEQLGIPSADAVGMNVVGADAEHDSIKRRETWRFHVVITENLHVRTDFAKALRYGVAGSRDEADVRGFVLNFRPDESRFGR